MNAVDKALERINKTLNRRIDEKLSAAAEKIQDMINSIDIGEMSIRADAGWKESDHPRGPDGKFVSVGGAPLHAIKAYEKTKNPGAKMTPQGMALFLIKQNKYSEKDIFSAMQAKFGLGPEKKNIVKAIRNKHMATPELQKKFDLPPLLAESDPSVKGEEEAAQQPAAPAPTTPAQAPAAPPPAPAPAPPPAPPAPSTPVEKAETFPTAVHGEIKGVIDNYSKLFTENKVQVDEKIDQIYDALQEKDPQELYKKSEAINQIPNPSFSQSISATNKAITEFQKYAADKAGITSYAPNTAKQKAAYAKFSKIAPKKYNNIGFWEDASGNELISSLQANTKDIPDDYYAVVSSAYDGQMSNSNSYQVDTAMQQYHDHVRYKSSTFTAEEENVMSGYKGMTYKAMNALLYDPNSPATAAKIKNSGYTRKQLENKNQIMQDAVNKSVIPADTPVYRGIEGKFSDLTGFQNLDDAIGRVFVHPNFASCSRAQSTSEVFGDPKSSYSTATMFKFTVPAGTKGLLLGSQTAGYEKEIVLPKNSIFKINKVEAVGNGHLVHVEYLGTKQDVP
jgi:hypothetical protein